MKYLYPYECEKEKFSSPSELQAAIDGNRREGRRSSYGAYSDLVPRGNSAAAAGHHAASLNALASHMSHMSPLSLVSRTPSAVNGNGNHAAHHGSASGGRPGQSKRSHLHFDCDTTGRRIQFDGRNALNQLDTPLHAPHPHGPFLGKFIRRITRRPPNKVITKSTGSQPFCWQASALMCTLQLP